MPLGYQELIIESEMDIDEPELDEVTEGEALESETEGSGEIGDAAATEEKTIEGAGETAAETEEVEDAGDAAVKATEDKTSESERLEDAGQAVEAVGESAEEAKESERVEGATKWVSDAADSSEAPRSRVDPNLIRSMLRDEMASGTVDEDAVDEDVMAAMRSTALLTIGLFAFVVICGVAVLARVRRR